MDSDPYLEGADPQQSAIYLSVQMSDPEGPVRMPINYLQMLLEEGGGTSPQCDGQQTCSGTDTTCGENSCGEHSGNSNGGGRLPTGGGGYGILLFDT